jgi:hypothetical protein
MRDYLIFPASNIVTFSVADHRVRQPDPAAIRPARNSPPNPHTAGRFFGLDVEDLLDGTGQVARQPHGQGEGGSLRMVKRSLDQAGM